MAGLPRLVWDRLRQRDVRDSARRLFYNRLLGARGAAHDAAALRRLASLASPPLPWPEVAMRPSALAVVLDEIETYGRSAIVECGGGLSTLYIGRLLRERGGTLTTIEHSAQWVEQLRSQLSNEALDAHVRVVHAPLQRPAAGAPSPWYERETLEPVGTAGIDMLVVDGPIASGEHPHVRYPALPYFYDRLLPDALVVLDDALRRGEREIVDRWRTEFGLPMEIRPLAGGIAVGRMPAAPRSGQV